ncbi:MAG: hypothetical protein ABW199_01935 [Caulobacterales bacterium]
MARISRRGLVLGASAAQIAAGASSEASPSKDDDDALIALCDRFVSLTRLQTELMIRWGKQEHWLAKNANWFALSKQEQRVLREARELFELDAQIESAMSERKQIARKLQAMPATSIAGVAAKLKAAIEEIDPDDNPSAFRILTSIVEEMEASPG